MDVLPPVLGTPKFAVSRAMVESTWKEQVSGVVELHGLLFEHVVLEFAPTADLLGECKVMYEAKGQVS